MPKSLEQLSPMLQQLLRKAKASYPDSGHRVWDVWDEAVGADVARRSHPLSLRRGQLVVAVSSSVWLQQMSFLRDSIRSAINKACGEEIVQEVRLRLSTTKAPSVRRPEPGRPPWLDQELDGHRLEAIEQDVARIEDPAVREAVRRARYKAEQARRFKEALEAEPPPENTGSRRRGETKGQ